MDGRMDKFIHAHMPEWTMVFHYLMPVLHMGSVVIKYFLLENLETYANIFHSQCPYANLHWFYYHVLFWDYIFWLFFKSSQPKIFRVFLIIGLLKHVILFSILSET